jgi:hypothetical protein
MSIGGSQLRSSGGQADSVGLQDPAGPAAAVPEHPQHQVLGAELAVPKAFGLLAGQVQHPAGMFALLGHLASSTSRTDGRCPCGARPGW